MVLKLKKELLTEDPELAFIITVTDTDIKTIKRAWARHEVSWDTIAQQPDRVASSSYITASW